MNNGHMGPPPCGQIHMKTLPPHVCLERDGFCTVNSNALWIMVTWEPPIGRQTRMKTLPSLNFFGLHRLVGS